MEKSNHRKLIVWQKAMELTAIIYKLVKKLPEEELHSLSDQICKAVVSIPSNIAEGQYTSTKKEFIQFLNTSHYSKTELETQLLVCVEVGYLNETDISEAMNLLTEIGKMLTSLIKKLKAKN
jgi:four helix bundle protein